MMGIDRLPIYEAEDAIVRALSTKENVRLIVEAPTGSGKSTQLPQILLDHGLVPKGEIVILQPRRIAARMLARRVAHEREGRVGDEIGYQVRFDRVAGKRTRVRYVTEGVLLRQFLEDRELKGVGAIVFDEFHERHVHGDVMLSLAIALQGGSRADLKVVVMSATLEADKLQQYLYPCSVVRSKGRTYPVEVKHLKQKAGNAPLWDSVTAVVRKEILEKGLSGDILIFLPGAYEIRRTVENLRRISDLKDCQLSPLYGELSPKEQDAAVAKCSGRKIVVATNVAETSLTIEGIRIVIDCGLARMSSFDQSRGINTLRIEKISRASADQRAGRAGRTAPGICLRIWSERDHASRSSSHLPELLRLDVSEILLLLMASGVEIETDLRWLDPPSESSLGRGMTLLTELGAIDRDQKTITEIGRKMVDFPAHPRFARMLVAASGKDFMAEAALCVALCQGRDLFVRKTSQKKNEFSAADDFSDFMPMLRAWNFACRAKFDVRKCNAYGIKANAAREAAAVMDSLIRVAQRQGIEVNQLSGNPDGEALARLLLVGFSDNVARRMSSGTLSCEIVGKRRGKLSKGSLASDEMILVAAEIAEVEGKEVAVILSKASSVKMAWLEDLFPNDFKEEETCRFDVAMRRVVGERVIRFRDLVLDSKASGEPAKKEAALVLAAEVMAERLKLKGWDGRCDSWIARIDCVRKNFPELEIPKFSEDDRRLVVTEVCDGAFSYKDIKERPVWPILCGWLSAEQTATVESFAPEKIRLSNGTEAKITYMGEDPKISVILQRLYGVERTPSVGGGRIPIVVEILGPNHRPVQRTSDLEGFWSNSYPEIKKQLKGRYPKHEWR